jgi:hypothetical protein
MPGLLPWMFGQEYDRALRITAWGSGYWTPSATEDLDGLVVLPTEFLGFDPVSPREIEVRWVTDGTPGRLPITRAVRGYWSRVSAGAILALYPALKVTRHYIMRIPYEIRDGRLYLQMGQWKAVPSVPRHHTTAEKPQPRRPRKRTVKK